MPLHCASNRLPSLTAPGCRKHLYRHTGHTQRCTIGVSGANNRTTSLTAAVFVSAARSSVASTLPHVPYWPAHPPSRLSLPASFHRGSIGAGSGFLHVTDGDREASTPFCPGSTTNFRRDASRLPPDRFHPSRCKSGWQCPFVGHQGVFHSVVAGIVVGDFRFVLVTSAMVSVSSTPTDARIPYPVPASG